MSRYLSSGRWYISDRWYTRKVIEGVLSKFRKGKRDYICECIYRKTKKGFLEIHEFTSGWYREIYGTDPDYACIYGFFGPLWISINNEKRVRFLKEMLNRL